MAGRDDCVLLIGRLSIGWNAFPTEEAEKLASTSHGLSRHAAAAHQLLSTVELTMLESVVPAE